MEVIADPIDFNMGDLTSENIENLTVFEEVFENVMESLDENFN